LQPSSIGISVRPKMVLGDQGRGPAPAPQNSPKRAMREQSREDER